MKYYYVGDKCYNENKSKERKYMRRIMGVGVGVTTSLNVVFRDVSLQSHLFWESSASVQGTPQQEAWRPQILRQQSNSEHRRQRLNPSRTQQYSDQMIYTLET